MAAVPWLVVVDMQVVFGERGSPWFTPGYPRVESSVRRLVPVFGDRVVYTRFVAPERPTGSWREYYRQWPFALVPADDPRYDLMPAFADTTAPVVSRTTFGKWGDELASIVGDATLVLVGVSTDCCVLATALAAADAGMNVQVVSDATAGVSDADHSRALSAMALWAPQITVVTADDVVAAVPDPVPTVSTSDAPPS